MDGEPGPFPHAIVPETEHSLGHVAEDLKHDWLEHGFVTIRDVFSADQVSRYNSRVTAARALLDDGKDEFGLGDRIGQLHQACPRLLDVASDTKIVRFLSWAFGEPPVLFGSLQFEKGTQQEAHIDAIFFWPEPAYSMAGVWVALEDVESEAGPLFYLPGSHKWPFFHGDDVIRNRPELREAWHRARTEGESDDIVGRMGVAWTEDFIAMERAKSAERIMPSLKAGDIVIWHSLLAHGGSPRNNPALSRRSAVFHFFGRDAKLFSFNQFMLNTRVELPGCDPVRVPRGIYNGLEYMIFDDVTTYSNGIENKHPVAQLRAQLISSL